MTTNIEKGLRGPEQEASQEEIESSAENILAGHKMEVDGRMTKINQSIENSGGKAERMNVWDAARGQIAGDQGWKLSIESKGTFKKGSLTEKVATAIDDDVFRERRGKTQDVVDFDAGKIFTKYIEENGGRFEGEQLEEVQKALELLALNGRYKFFKWQNSSQLENVIAMQDKLVKSSEGFDPEKTGFSETLQLVEHGMACVNLDLTSKPNYNAIPEYPKRQQDCQRMLSGISRVEAIINNK